MSNKYIYNLTLHCDKSIANDVRYYIQQILLPAWQKYDYFSGGVLLERVPLEGEDEGDSVSIAIQFTCDDRPAFNIGEDSFLLKVFSTYPNRLLYTESFLKIIK